LNAARSQFEKKDDKDPGRLISWKQHFYQYKCDDHGYIGRTENGKAPQCLKCKELPKEQQCKKELKSKLTHTDMKKPIGVFIKDYLDVFIRDKYRQHWWLKKALGTHYCLAMREKVLLNELRQHTAPPTCKDALLAYLQW
jgi:hypothetical protein